MLNAYWHHWSGHMSSAHSIPSIGSAQRLLASLVRTQLASALLSNDGVVLNAYWHLRLGHPKPSPSNLTRGELAQRLLASEVRTQTLP